MRSLEARITFMPVLYSDDNLGSAGGDLLLCDSGHMSRAAGEILAEEEGFTRVFSLRGGTRRWRKWHESRTQACCLAAIRRCRGQA